MATQRTEARAVVPAGMEAAVERWSYSPGVVYDGLLHISGQVGRTAAGQVVQDPEEQYVTAFENVGAVLREAGATFADVISVTTYHTTFDGFELFADVKKRYLSVEPYPTWTGIGVTALALPGLLVEIQTIARL